MIIGSQPIKGNAKLGYNIGKVISELKQSGQIAKEQEQALFISFGAIEKNGQLCFEDGQLSPDEDRDFETQYAAIQNLEIEIWGTPILLHEIDAAGLSLAPIQYDLLSWLIADPANENAQETVKAATA